MSKMNLKLRWDVLPPTIDGVDSILITVVEDGGVKRYRIKAKNGELWISADGQLLVKPEATNLVRITYDSF